MTTRPAQLTKTQRLTNMSVDKVALVDRGANGRTFAVLKRDGAGRGPRTVTKTEADAAAITAQLERHVRLGKAVPSFEQLIESRALEGWLPAGLEALSAVLWAVLTATDDGGEPLTPEVRMTAAIGAVDQFRAELLDRMAATIAKRHGQRSPALVAKAPTAGPQPLRGLL